MDIRNIIDEIVESSARELFAGYGTALAPATQSLAPHEHVAIIGFHGDHVRGALGVALDRKVLAHMAVGGRSDRRYAEDCICEAANQLIGRMKNKLLGYGLAFGIELPVTLRGLEVQLSRSSSEVWSYRFTSPVGGVTIWLDAQFDPSFVFERREEDGGEVLACREGELTMF